MLKTRITYKNKIKWISALTDHFFKCKIKMEVDFTSFGDSIKREVLIYLFPRNLETWIFNKYPIFGYFFSNQLV